MNTRFLLLFGLPAVFSVLVTPWVIRLAHRIGAIDQPNERKIHSHPVPRFGGVGIYLSMILSLGMMLIFDPSIAALFSTIPHHGLVLMGSLLLVLVLGAWDDLHSLSPGQKFFVQLIAATIVYLGGIRISAIAHPLSTGLLDLGLLDYPATVLWIVGITNAFNLIDGLDGLASGVSIIASVTIGAVSFLKGDIATASLSLMLAGSVFGFLRYNFNPARIFLGDSGSLLLGFSLAVLSIQSSTKGSTVVALLVPILALGLPIMDTLLSMTRRLLRSVLAKRTGSESFLHKLDNIFLPDREHIHHKLIARGLSHKRVVFVLYLVSCAFGAVAFAVTLTNNLGASLILLAVAIATFVGIRQLRYREMAVLRNGVLLPMYEWPIINRSLFQGFLDLGFVSLSFYLAHVLTYRGELTPETENLFFFNLSIVSGIQLLIFYFAGLYKGTFRHLGIGDVLKMVKTIALSVLVVWVIITIRAGKTGAYSSSVFILDFYFLLSLVLGTRISFHVLNYISRRGNNTGKRVLIYGADTNGILTVQQLLNDGQLNMTPVGFIDDSPQLEGKNLNGYPIFGGHWKLERLLKTIKIDQILLATECIKPEIMNRLREFSYTHGISVQRFKIRLEDVSFESSKSSRGHQSISFATADSSATLKPR